MAFVTVPSSHNLMVNPSAEVNTFGWEALPIGGTTGTTSTVGRITGWRMFGAYGFSLTYTAPGGDRTGMSARTVSTLGAFTIAVDPAKGPLSAGVWAKPYNPLASTSLVRLGFIFRNGAGSSLTATLWSADYLIPNTATNGQYITHENVEIPADAASVLVYIAYYGTDEASVMGDGSSLYWDGVQVNHGPTVENYVDGDQGPRYSWDGTAHASTSTRAEYTYRAQAPARRGKTKISAELWRYTLTGEPLEDITHAALSGKVTMNSNAEIKGSLALKLRALNLVKPFVDHVAPFIILTNADGESQRYQMGLYAIPPGKESHTQLASTVTLEGRDVTWYLANDYPTSVVNYATGANVVDIVKDICASHGLNINIPLSSKTLPKAKTFQPDKSWLQIANDLLTGISYYSLWADRYGMIKSVPYFELAGAQPTLELYSGEGSMVINTVDQEGTYEGLANRIVVYKANTQGAPIVASRTNSEPMSPISTVSVGRTITRMIADTNLVDQASADAMAKRYLEESASYTKKMKVTTLPTPDRDLHEVYDMSLYNERDEVIAFGKWWCDTWECEIGFRPVNAIMTHHIKRLEPYGGEEQ